VPIETPKPGFASLSKSVKTTLVPAIIILPPVLHVIVPSLPANAIVDPIPVVSSSVK
jgi:hypothetical protein